MQGRRILREKLSIPKAGSTRGEVIRGELDRLEGSTSTKADTSCVVLCHGQWSSLYDPLMLSISEGILKGVGGDLDPASLHTTAFDHTLRSDGSSSTKQQSIEVVRFSFTTASSQPFSGYYEESRELSYVVDYLEGKLKKKVQCIVGHSKAATVICIYAAHHRCRLQPLGLVCISGRFDFSKLEGVSRSIGQEIVDHILVSGSPQLVEISTPKKREPFWLTRERLEERASIKMQHVIENLKMKKEKLTEHGQRGEEVEGSIRGGGALMFCVVHGSQDERIPVSAAHKYAEAFHQAGGSQDQDGQPHGQHRQCQLRIIRDANHCFTKPEHRREMVKYVSRVVHQQVHFAKHSRE